MSDLTEFLLARIAEDEAVAREVVEESFNGDGPISTGDDPWPSEAAFAGRHTPARVLAECEVKRRIVEGHGANRYRVDPCDAHDANFEAIPCDTLRWLATPYADHPDYREEWKP